MLAENTVVATLAVKDRETNKKFYGETLGLKQSREDEGGVEYTSGDGRIYVYESDTAGQGKATCAFWYVDDLDACIEELKSKGVTFEHYDLPWATREGDVHTTPGGEERVAWFKDPDGNILGLGSKNSK
jgi:catechol 2,3-dioxygenase-like lactoylglutathione lyase family enzyme